MAYAIATHASLAKASHVVKHGLNGQEIQSPAGMGRKRRIWKGKDNKYFHNNAICCSIFLDAVALQKDFFGF